MALAQTNIELQKLRTQVISAGVSSTTPVHVASARGAIVRDVEGRDYIDFGGGISVMNIGHSHPRVVAAIKAQADKFHAHLLHGEPLRDRHPAGGQALPPDAGQLPQEGHAS